MNMGTAARRALATAALLSAGAFLPAAGTVAAYASEGNVWILTLAQNLKNGKLVMANGPGEGSAVTRMDQSWNIMPTRTYQLSLQDLDKRDTTLEFRLSNTQTKGYVRLVMEIGDGNSAVNPTYKPVIKKLKASVFYQDPASASGGQMLPANWGDLFDMQDLDKGDLVIKARNLSVLHP
jgi:hypothetical protein